MRFVTGYLATLGAVMLLALGAATMSLDAHAHKAMGAGVLGAGFGVLLFAWHLLQDRNAASNPDT